MIVGISALFNFSLLILLLLLHIILTHSFYLLYLKKAAGSISVKITAWVGLYLITLLLSMAWFWFAEGNGVIEDLLVFQYFR